MIENSQQSLPDPSVESTSECELEKHDSVKPPNDTSSKNSEPMMSGKVWCDVNPKNIITEKRRKIEENPASSNS